VGGLALMAVGIVLLPMPGPGMLVIAVGAALVAEESKWAAELLDGLELWVRRTLEKLRGRGKKRRAIATL
jgi:hypothetical protein